METNQKYAGLIQIKNKLDTAELPVELRERLSQQLHRLERIEDTVTIEKELLYIEFILSLPFNRTSQDILDLNNVTNILNKNHFGLTAAKERILEYLSILILNARQGRKMKAPIMALIGLVGSGKTSLAYSVAESLGRKIIRIPFGGLGSVQELRGQSRTRSEAEPGKIIKAIVQSGVNNPVILLDEIDRITEESRADVMGVLVELLDPEQNYAFVDHFVDYPFDLSKVLFIATANNTNNIATAVMDRLEVVEMPAYTDQEKMMIGKTYLLPKVIEEAAIGKGMIELDDSTWELIVRPLGYDAGIRSLHRTIQKIVRKVARQQVLGKTGPISVNHDNIGQYLE